VDDRELIAAILRAGMLPTIPVPQARPMTEAEREAIEHAVAHAIGLYRTMLGSLGIDSFAGLPGHDAPRQ
jgi:hypothetical protein